MAMFLTKEEGKYCVPQAKREVSSGINVEKTLTLSPEGAVDLLGRIVLPRTLQYAYYPWTLSINNIAISCNRVVLGITKNAHQISRHPPGDSVPPTFCREDIELPQTLLSGKRP